MVRLFSAFLVILFLFTACSDESGDKKILEKIAGKDYSKIIEIPTDRQGRVDTAKMARIHFEDKEFAFDTINEGDIIQKNFIFSNAGVKDLYILQTNVSCGCTVTKYPKYPVLPGKQDTISVTFDSNGQKGVNNKKVTVYTNSFPAEEVLTVKGYVKAKQQ